VQEDIIVNFHYYNDGTHDCVNEDDVEIAQCPGAFHYGCERGRDVDGGDGATSGSLCSMVMLAVATALSLSI